MNAYKHHMDVKNPTKKQSNGCSSWKWSWWHDHLFANILALLPKLSRTIPQHVWVGSSLPLAPFPYSCHMECQEVTPEGSLNQHAFVLLSRMPEGEEREQGIENLFEKLKTKKFSNVVKEQTYKSRKHRKSQPRWTQRGPHQDIS